MSKLIRDGLPEIMTASGIRCRLRVAEDSEYLNFLKQKLLEESNEFNESHSLDELADLVEVIRAILTTKNTDWYDLERIRLKKLADRGGFEKRLILET